MVPFDQAPKTFLRLGPFTHGMTEELLSFRKTVMALTGASLMALALHSPLQAADVTGAHALSLFGTVKYDKDFPHFDYVNAEAPKGGKLRYAAIGTFDTLNPFVVKGRPASGVTFIYDTLMVTAMDEASTEYGLLAESVSHPEDFSSVTFKLREEARFHDGEPVKPEDVIWSFETLKKHNPFFTSYYKDVTKAEKTGPHEVTFTFSQTGNRELPLIMGQLYVMPKHYWEGREFNTTTLEAPLGSGPYKIGNVKPGQSLTYERVADYWGKDVNVNIGAHNFGEIEFIYFGDPTVALEAFKAGNVDVRIENSARNWATAYDTPAVKQGKIVLDEIATENSSGMQAFVFNLRREKFQDPRVREALNYAFDFKWMNRTLFYDQYTRTDSFFDNSELASSGLPEGRELELLEPYRDQLPEEVFTQAYKNPESDGSGTDRQNLRKALELFKSAGWEVQDGKLVNAETGKPFEIEFLLVDPAFERVMQAYLRTLERLGITGSIRPVDTAQYQNRVDNYEFDAITASFPQSLSPGNEQRDFWGCASGQNPGGRNLMGICNPVVEALIEKVIYAGDREELVAATRALDRVLLWNHYVVPQWHAAADRYARWSYIKHPEPAPAYSSGFPTIWWDARAGKE